MTDLLIEVGPQGRIVFQSAASDPPWLGYGHNSLLGKALHDLLPPEECARLEGLLAAPPPEQRDGVADMAGRGTSLRRADGAWWPVTIHPVVSPPREGEEAGRLLLGFWDAARGARPRAALDQRQHAEEIGRVKGEFLATMSHEIRTPMSSIIGLIDLLKNTDLSPKQKDYVDALDRAGEHLADLLDDILDFSKIEAQKIDSESVIFDLRRVLQGVVEIFRARAESKGVQVRLFIAEGLERLWRGDLRHLRQVLANLLGNAVKFTDSGHVELSVTLERGDNGPTVLRFAVEDTGIGIDPRLQNKIFEPFAQADQNPTRRHGGTGLGLAISRRLVDLMGGRIWVSSHPGRGSTFSLTVPFTPADSAAEPARPEAASSRMFFGRQVLVVDDSDLNRLVLGDMLRSLGVEVTTATNGREAVRVFKDIRFDLVFMDVQMPVLDGISATREIRAWEERQKTGTRCPIIALSATALKDDRDTALVAGCEEYMVKPLRKEAMTGALRTYLEVPGTGEEASITARGEADILEPELAPLLPSFFAHYDQEYTQLNAAVHEGDWDRIHRLAHAMKGNAMLFGFRSLVEALRSLERLAREREAKQLRGGDVSLLQEECNRVEVEAQALRRRFLPPPIAGRESHP